MLRKLLRRPKRWPRRRLKLRNKERSTRLKPKRRPSDLPSEGKQTRSWPRMNINKRLLLLPTNIICTRLAIDRTQINLTQTAIPIECRFEKFWNKHQPINNGHLESKSQKIRTNPQLSTKINNMIKSNQYYLENNTNQLFKRRIYSK